ncbi:MAG: TSUP family transporter [Verrucomicrobia bacterium]|nr:TSUP family transporter [Verrucomicrobiota bacterium]
MELPSAEIIALLMAVALLSGFVDAIGGGGGLLTVPALLWTGMTPVQALATNKLQSSWGTLAATWNFHRRGHFNLRQMWPAVTLTFVGSAAGTLIVQELDASFLMRFIPVLLIVVAGYFLLQPRMGETDRHQRMSLMVFSCTFGFGIGFYDGFFGPGTGSFFALAFVTLLGFNLLKATAHTKLLNLTSNLASLLFFAINGHVLWGLGMCMAIAQIAGGFLGSSFTMRHGAKVIRPVLIVMSLALTIKLLFD